jgi:DNA (cytosine-5)-methyltransferase 1
MDELQPKVFVMENVSGMVKGKMKGKFKEIMRSLKELNYEVKCKLLNTKYYNVPQSRERLIWIGVRKDLNRLPTFPRPNLNVIPVIEAFKNLPNNNLAGTAINTLNLKTRIHLLKQGQSANELFSGNKYFNTVRLSWFKPSPTILKTKSLIHPREHRYLSISECKHISSFPDDFGFVGSFQQQWGQIGNAVMPRFMQAIASHIRDNILN